MGHYYSAFQIIIYLLIYPFMVIFCRHDKQCKRRNEDSLKYQNIQQQKKIIQNVFVPQNKDLVLEHHESLIIFWLNCIFSPASGVKSLKIWIPYNNFT